MSTSTTTSRNAGGRSAMRIDDRARAAEPVEHLLLRLLWRLGQAGCTGSSHPARRSTPVAGRRLCLRTSSRLTLRRIVASHAARLVPGVKLRHERNARRYASCTSSSADCGRAGQSQRDPVQLVGMRERILLESQRGHGASRRLHESRSGPRSDRDPRPRRRGYQLPRTFHYVNATTAAAHSPTSVLVTSAIIRRRARLPPPPRPDSLIVGAGLAGLYAALARRRSRRGRHAGDQGLAARLELVHGPGRRRGGDRPGRLPEQHFADTITAGRGLCDPAAVRVLVDRGHRPDRRPRAGWASSSTASRTAATHSAARAATAAPDPPRRRRATGAAIAETLIAPRARRAPDPRARARRRDRPDLRRRGAAPAPGCSATTSCWPCRRRMTLLATGRRGCAVRTHDQPPGATRRRDRDRRPRRGRVADMEFVQFHPTALAVGERAFLISEAVRGDGAYLVDEDGERFMLDVTPTPSWRPASRGARRSSPQRKTGRPPFCRLGTSTPAQIRVAFPNLVGGLRGRGPRPDPRPDPGCAGRPLPDGRRRDRPRRRDHAGRALTPAASAPATGVTAPTGSPPTRCSSASSSLTERRRRARDQSWPPVDAAAPDTADVRAPLAELRRRMWREAGPARTGAGLEPCSTGSTPDARQPGARLATQIVGRPCARPHSSRRRAHPPRLSRRGPGLARRLTSRSGGP